MITQSVARNYVSSLAFVWLCVTTGGLFADELTTAASVSARAQAAIDRGEAPSWWSPKLPDDVERDVTSKGKKLASSLQLSHESQEKRAAELIAEHFRRVWAWHQQVDEKLNAGWSAWDNARDNTKGKQKDELKALLVWTEQLEPIYAEFTPQIQLFLNSLNKEIGEAKTTELIDLITRSPGAKRTYEAYLAMVPELTDTEKAILWSRMARAREDSLAAWSDKQIVKIFKMYKVRNELSIDHFGYGYQQRYQAWVAKEKK